MSSETYVSKWAEFERERRERKRQHDRSWYQVIAFAMALGVVAMAVVANSRQSFACALLIGTAATLTGALAGFVFGIPKTVAARAGTDTEKDAFTGNTNLEEISDWLTKILVGAGLVELGKVLEVFKSFGSSFDGLSKPLGEFGWVVAPSLVVAYFTCGFLLAYLWARIYITGELERRAAVQQLAIAAPGLSVPPPPPPPNTSPTDTSTTDTTITDTSATDTTVTNTSTTDT